MAKFTWLPLAAALTATALAPAMAATDAEITTAIDNGLAWLAGQQQADGSWAYGGYDQAATGAVVAAFISQQSHWGADATAYQTVVNNGISYLLDTASTSTVSTRNDGVNICPAGGSCTGVYWYGAGESTYTTGLVATAIDQYGETKGASAVATASGPLAGYTWGQIAQGITNEYSASQSSVLNGNRDGGWRYYIPGNGDSDMSTTQWAVLSLIYDQTLGATTPAAVKSDLASWLAFAQDPGTGAGCYQGPASGLCENSDTGGLLLSLKFLGASISDPAVQAALNFLNANWPTYANSTWYGNFGQPYAMWADYKALELWLGLDDTTTITNLLSTCSGAGLGSPTSGICNWWQDYNQWLVANQNADGSWNGYAYWYGPLATAFDVGILGATYIPIPVSTPEPASLALLGAGVAGLGLLRRRRA